MALPDPQNKEFREQVMLRIGFADASREDLPCEQSPVRIGAAEDNDLVLSGAGIADRHLTLHARYGLWLLRVEPDAEHVYVNARPVREQALLRPGDALSVCGHKLVLLAAREEVPTIDFAPRAGSPDRSCAPCGLRCVAGPLSGRFLSVRPDRQLDHMQLPDMQGVLRLRYVAGGIVFEVADADTLEPCCNGIAGARGLLRLGDQLTWGRHRFVVEDLPVPSEKEISRTPEPQPDAPLPQNNNEHHELFWLLGVAVILALCIAGLLLLRP